MAKKKGKKKNKGSMIINLILILILIAGLSLLLYPTFSDLWNSSRQSRAINHYADVVESLNEEDYDKLWQEAEAYNKGILERTNLYYLSEEEKEEYERLLNVAGDGIMAYIEIPSINCQLPVYHGTEENVLQVAVGHLDWTSLPVGGESTHSVFSGHSGLPSAKLFTDIDKLEIGDQFYITTLGEKMAYEVDQILTVLPEEVEDLEIVEGEDYVTLVTCTPYGINTHRLLVRGHRVEYVEPETEAKSVIEEVIVTENLSQRFWTMVVIVFSGLILLIIITMLIFRKKKRK